MFTSEIARLNFEDVLWGLFVLLCIMNIMGDKEEKEYIETGNDCYKTKANHIFETTLMITILIYIYFFLRNYEAYEKASIKEKELYKVKLLGSSFLIAGALCLLYFQRREESFVGSPAL